MRLLNRATGQDFRYRNGWIGPTRPVQPVGGTTIDAEARTAIGQILAALTGAGVIPT